MHVGVILGPSKSSKKSNFSPKTVTGPAIFPYVSDRTPEPLFSPMSAKDAATFPYVCDRTTSVMTEKIVFGRIHSPDFERNVKENQAF